MNNMEPTRTTMRSLSTAITVLLTRTDGRTQSKAPVTALQSILPNGVPSSEAKVNAVLLPPGKIPMTGGC